MADVVPVVEGDFSDFVDELLLFFSDLSFGITIPMIIKQHNILPQVPLLIRKLQQLRHILNGIITLTLRFRRTVLSLSQTSKNKHLTREVTQKRRN